MQHQHAVSVLDRVLQIVGDHDAGEVVVDYLLIRQFQNQFGRFRIQGCRMFIQQQDIRSFHRCHQQSDGLPLTARQQPDIRAHPIFQA